jgi:hypothetical protein
MTEKKTIETRKDEVRLSTSDPHEMINKYLAERLLRGWEEDFVDEDSGEVVTIERHEVIADRGQFIDPELLSSINFYLQSGDVKEVFVSNQRREAVLEQNNHFFPWLATVRVGAKNKKLLLYATAMETAIEVLKDYVELNYSGAFQINQLKEYGSCIILRDSLKKYYPDGDPEAEPIEETDELEGLKFYQIDVAIEADEMNQFQTFVVETKDTEKAMIIINDYIVRLNKENESNFEYCNVRLETAKVLSCDNYIEKEFSMAYADN